jgi:DNA-directed RNA polymerase subunit RPC12/RpoP
MKLEKYFALQKFDERTGLTTGIMTAAIPDSDDEIFDYDGGGKADIQRWSNEAVASTSASGQEISLGPIRLQHDQSKIGGKAVAIMYDDNAKTITLTSQPVNDEVRRLILKGYLRGYSICGGYRSRNCAECNADMMPTMAARTNYCPQCQKRVMVKFVPAVVETSYVDSPSLKEAVFTVIKADGTQESKTFSKQEQHMKLLQDHFRKAAAHHKKLAKSHAGLVDQNNQLARGAEGRADFAAAKCFKSMADEHATIARLHDQHVEQLSALANAGPDVWAWAGQNVDPDGRTVTDGSTIGSGKASKVADEFFDRFVYGSDPSGGLFGAPSHSDILLKQSPSGGLFK